MQRRGGSLYRRCVARKSGDDTPSRGFTFQALMLNALLFEDGATVGDLQAAIEQVIRSEASHPALAAAGRTLVEDGSVVAEKVPRDSGGGPPVVRYRLTEKGRRAALELREQAERYVFLPKYKGPEAGS